MMTNMFYDDIRVNDYYPKVENIHSYNWSFNWTQFPGLPYCFAIDIFLYDQVDIILYFMQKLWFISFFISAIYLLTIFSIQKLMVDRKPLNLRRPLVVWNILLAVFSIMGTIRCLPEFIDILTKKGFRASFCDSSYHRDIRLVAWYWYFVMSKAIELGDTLFIVLRKQKLNKIHWIHHIVTLCFCWFVFADVPGTARWMVNMNYLIHSVMYTYYALRASGMKIRKQLAMCITVSQIVQMLFGFYINIKAFQYKITGVPCDLSLPVGFIGFLIYSIFFVLFINYFIKSYILPIFKYSNPNQKPHIVQDINENVIKKSQ